jgi:alkylation response protein AidB-like acyl-CoA dehydrogenase
VKRVLTAREREIVDLAAGLAAEFAERASEHDRENTFPFENWPRMQEAGYLALTVPQELGGYGASLHEFLLAQEMLASGDGSTALAVDMHHTTCNGVANMWRRTQAPRAEEFLRGVVSGDVVFATVTSEAGFGGALENCATAATKVDGGYLLNGHKIFFTESPVATHFVTVARHEDPERGPMMYFFNFIPIDSPGITIKQTWDTMGMRGTQSNDVIYEDLFVPDELLFHSYPVGHLDAAIGLSVMTWNVVSFGAIALGIAGGAFEWAREYVQKRGRQHAGQVQNHFAEMEVLLESARAVIYRHSHEVTSGLAREQLSVQEIYERGNLAKYVSCENAIDVMDRVVEVCGGVGYHKRFPIERMYRDVRAGAIMPYNSPEARELFAETAFGIERLPIIDFHETGLQSRPKELPAAPAPVPGP